MALAWCWGRRRSKGVKGIVCMRVLWMDAHTFLVAARALAVAVMMEVQEGKVASAEASKEAD